MVERMGAATASVGAMTKVTWLLAGMTAPPLSRILISSPGEPLAGVRETTTGGVGAE